MVSGSLVFPFTARETDLTIGVLSAVSQVLCLLEVGQCHFIHQRKHCARHHGYREGGMTFVFRELRSYLWWCTRWLNKDVKEFCLGSVVMSISYSFYTLTRYLTA